MERLKERQREKPEPSLSDAQTASSPNRWPLKPERCMGAVFQEGWASSSFTRGPSGDNTREDREADTYHKHTTPVTTTSR